MKYNELLSKKATETQKTGGKLSDQLDKSKGSLPLSELGTGSCQRKMQIGCHGAKVTVATAVVTQNCRETTAEV